MMFDRLQVPVNDSRLVRRGADPRPQRPSSCTAVRTYAFVRRLRARPLSRDRWRRTGRRFGEPLARCIPGCDYPGFRGTRQRSGPPEADWLRECASFTSSSNDEAGQPRARGLVRACRLDHLAERCPGKIRHGEVEQILLARPWRRSARCSCGAAGPGSAARDRTGAAGLASISTTTLLT